MDKDLSDILLLLDTRSLTNYLLLRSYENDVKDYDNMDSSHVVKVYSRVVREFNSKEEKKGEEKGEKKGKEKGEKKGEKKGEDRMERNEGKQEVVETVETVETPLQKIDRELDEDLGVWNSDTSSDI